MILILSFSEVDIDIGFLGVILVDIDIDFFHFQYQYQWRRRRDLFFEISKTNRACGANDRNIIEMFLKIAPAALFFCKFSRNIMTNKGAAGAICFFPQNRFDMEKLI